MNIYIDNSAPGQKYRGLGMISANNSSRLLMDYKWEHPEKYEEIMRLLFTDEGLTLCHLKIEMGSDINSSSGTEPCVKRYENERCDVTRGAGFMLAADAKALNPELTLDMLWWSEPLWVSEASNVYAARYRWYKETLAAAYDTYGLKFDYVSANQNERAIDADWIKYLSKALKSERDCPYDYSGIKIVAADEVGTWKIADMMLSDKELLDAVDVIGSHYTSASADSAKRLAREYKKELWFSEGSPPMNYPSGGCRFDGTGSGLSGVNAALDIADRIISMYPQGLMTLYEFQPAVEAYYDGANYCHKRLIAACDPWSGYYSLDSGFYTALHFSKFFKKGWEFVDSACFSDGKPGGDGHAIVDAKYAFMTACDPVTGDYSTVIANTTYKAVTYDFTIENMKNGKVYVWETRGPEVGAFNKNYFRKTDKFSPVGEDGMTVYSVTVMPYSIVTVTTLDIPETKYNISPESERTVLALPYTDDFGYDDYDSRYSISRGGAPRYFTDEGGAFEIEEKKERRFILRQKITPETKAREWEKTPEPTACFGDDRWFNYAVAADVMFEKSDDPANNYVGVGVRYSQSCKGMSGYCFRLYENGEIRLMSGGSLAWQISGTSGFNITVVHNIRLLAVYDTVYAYLDGALALWYKDSKPIPAAGRAALYSSYNKNSFSNIAVTPAEGAQPYIQRFDNTDMCCAFSGDWKHDIMAGCGYLNRTVSQGFEGAGLTVKFNGTGFALTGENPKEGVIVLSIDGGARENHTIPKTFCRSVLCIKNGLSDTEHTAELTVLSGTFAFDGVQVEGSCLTSAPQRFFGLKKPAFLETFDKQSFYHETNPNTADIDERGDPQPPYIKPVKLVKAAPAKKETRLPTVSVSIRKIAICAGVIAAMGILAAIIRKKKKKKKHL